MWKGGKLDGQGPGSYRREIQFRGKGGIERCWMIRLLTEGAVTAYAGGDRHKIVEEIMRYTLGYHLRHR